MKKFELPILYKIDTKGKIRIWQVHTEGPVIVCQHGLLDGKLITTRTDAKPKNVGRANETTAEEQAELEATSLWKDKSVKYSEEIPKEGAQNKKLTPMLAKSLDDKAKKKLKFPVDIQPKLDGVRCLAIIKGEEVTLESRSGKPIINDYLAKSLKALKLNDCILDGELYLHNSLLQDTISVIHSYPYKIQYHIYDIPEIKGDDSLSWKERRRALDQIKAAYGKDGQLLKEYFDTENKKTLIPQPRLFVVNTETASDEEELYAINSHHLKNGYEGSMVRKPSSKYKWNARSSDLLKIKIRQDSEFVISEVTEGKGKMAGCAIFTCKNDLNDLTFKCVLKNEKLKGTTKGTLEIRKEIYENKNSYIGKTLTVEYFCRTDKDLPRDPVGVKIKDDIEK